MPEAQRATLERAKKGPSLLMKGWGALFRRAGKRFSMRANRRRTHIAIKCPVPDNAKTAWGDYHFAKALAKALGRQGFRVRVDLLPEWTTVRSPADDVVIVLRGLSPYSPSKEQINLCWLISHPEGVPDVELEQYDHVFVASTGYAETLGRRLAKPVAALLQCSDPEIFHLPKVRPDDEIDILFVGNSRGQARKIVTDALSERLPIAVYGRHWDGRIDPSVIRGHHIKNRELHAYYGSAKIVLNDHWPDMRANGFVSNRIFDAGLSGGFVISDTFAGAELFKDCIVTYETPAELRELCQRWLADEKGRRAVAARLRDCVLSQHTFDHRAGMIAATVARLLRCKYEKVDETKRL